VTLIKNKLSVRELGKKIEITEGNLALKKRTWVWRPEFGNVGQTDLYKGDGWAEK